MILSVLVIVLVAVIAYFHYVEGFFSATISAILAAISAAIALSYQEPLTRLLQGKFPDNANALAIIAIFAVTYTILRLIFDKAIPGNIRLPVIMDKVGAGIAGIFAGIFAVGILVIAAQMLPFGPSIAGYSRYKLTDVREAQIPTGRQAIDTHVYNELFSSTFVPEDKTSLILPVDDIVVNLTSHLSDGGSLAGPVDFAQVHPSYLDELFGQRLGVQTGARHVAINLDHEKDVDLRGIYTVDSLPQAESEIPSIRKTDAEHLKPVKSDPSEIILIVRITLTKNAADSDSNVRISTGGVRLVANQKNYMPLGTLDSTGSPLLRMDHPDDFLIVPADGTVDFIFLVPRSEFGLDANPKDKNPKLAIGPNVFMEVKRAATIDLDGHDVTVGEPPATKPGVLRKQDLNKRT